MRQRNFYEKQRSEEIRKEFIDFFCEKFGWNAQDFERFIEIVNHSHFGPAIYPEKVMWAVMATKEEPTRAKAIEVANRYDVPEATALAIYYNSTNMTFVRDLVWDSTTT
jgi:hypothetical protein